MNVIAGLMIFSGFGAWLSARHKAAVPAAMFSMLATVLFVTTPLGGWVPGVLIALVHGVSTVGGQLASAGGAR
jgi:hypothetical protein